MENTLSAAMQNYLMAVYILEKENKVARVSDIGRKMKVRKASVVSAVNFLKRAELIRHERYGFITLTPRGAEAAKAINAKFEILADFLENTLKLEKEKSRTEAGGIFHAVSMETAVKIKSLAESLNKTSALSKQGKKIKNKKKARKK